MSATVVRPTTAADLPAVRAVHRQTIHALMQQHGRGDDISHICPLVPAEWEHVLTTDPDLHWMAETNGTPVGYVSSILRGGAWFLSGFWVLPELQGTGIGGEILRRARAAADARGAVRHTVYSSSTLSAQALYIREGMVPRTPIYMLTGLRRRLVLGALRHAPMDGAAIHPVDPSDALVNALTRVDAHVRGAARTEDHRYWLARPTRTCLVYENAGAIAGYAYATDGGRIGPVAAENTGAIAPLIGAAVHVAANRSAAAHARRAAETDDVELLAAVPGVNITALRTLLACGFRIEWTGTWMADAEAGHLDRYVISGAILF